MNQEQLRNFIKRTLTKVSPVMATNNAVELLMLTAAQESHLGEYIRQLNNGPAMGIFQMEPRTHDDICFRYLNRKGELKASILRVSNCREFDSAVLEYNLAYSTALARAFYRRFPEALPSATDVEGLARYWKKYWNTELGAGTVEEAVENYERFCR